MNRIIILILAIWLAACNQQSTQDEVDPPTNFNEELRTELMDILIKDQDLRIALDTMENMYDWESETVQNTWKQIHYNDSVNLVRIEAIIDEHGWPEKSLVGEDLADVPFLVLQHCSDVETMEKYLPLLEEAVKNEELDKASFAMYADRLKMFKGEDQLYGTQLSWDYDNDEYQLYPVEDEENLNARRAEMGLSTIEAYLEHFGMEYKKPE